MFYSDQQLQDYLDGRMTAVQEAQFEIELGKDRRLREELDNYRELYAGLEDDSQISLPSSFTHQVMKKANLATFGSLHFGLWQIFIALAVVIVAINVSFLYVDMGKLVQDVTAKPEAVPVPTGVENQVNTLFDQIINLHINTPIPILAVVILIILFFFDRFLTKQRNKMHWSGKLY